MNLKHDLLYIIPEESFKVDPALVDDLQLRSCFNFAGTDSDYFIDIISTPLKKIENLLYRREIIYDFLSIPELFSRLYSCFSKFMEESKKRQSDFAMSATVRRINNSRDFYSSKNSAQFNCTYFRNDLLIIRDIDKILCKYSLKSKGLNKIKQRISEIVNDSSYIKLIDILKYIEEISVDDEFLMSFEFGEMGVIKDYDIQSFEEEEKYTPKTFFKKLKNETNVTAEASLTNAKNEYLARRLDDISSAVVMMDKMLFREFSDVARQLCFYRSALEFIRIIREEKELPTVFPDICENKIMIEELYDVKLIADGKKVVPNDVLIPADVSGMVIRGENSSGKTVFVRSVGIAQLLFSVGLPVVAKSASMSLVNGIFSQFSSSEKVKSSSDETGRFEQEVKVFADMFNKIRPGSLVILNESFQTTQYSEGAECLYHILRAINYTGSKWILVTHIKEIFNLFIDNSVLRFEMSSDGSHKIHKC